MRVFVGFRMRVMHPVRRHPFHRIVLHRHRAERRQRIFEPLRSLKTSMRQQPMVTEPDAEAADNPIPDHHQGEIFPAQEKQRRNAHQMKRSDDK